MTATVSAGTLERLRRIATETIVSELNRRGYSNMVMEGVRSLIPGQRLAGRAVTLRFVPVRPDLRRDGGERDQTAEYRAMELCGQDDVLVMDAMRRPFASTGGDVKFLRLKQRRAEGIVTDGAVRDGETLKSYGFCLFAAGVTPKLGPVEMLPWGINEVIQCAGVAVRPGDVIVGDDDGVVAIPAELAEEITEAAEEHERIEQFVKDLIEREDCSPGRYYPFNEDTYRLYAEWKERTR